MAHMVRAGFWLNVAACVLVFILMVAVIEPSAATWMHSHGNLVD
jgi:hypothetical protein